MEASLFSSYKTVPCLASLQVYDMEGGGVRAKIWEIRASRAECVRVEKVTVGVPPDGFTQQERLNLPLRSGKYRVDAWDGTDRGGGGAFRIP